MVPYRKQMYKGALLAVVFPIIVFCQNEYTVNTRLGNVKGLEFRYENKSVYKFRKIPYAKPPIGPLRFSKPEPYGSWSTVLNATSFSPSCMQEVYFEADSVVSEDCLFLNIYVPGNISSTNNKPVMIWIHGGGLTIGSGLWYDGSYLALSGDVIVVTLNYRLNIFGFISSGDSALPGNYGLWDQRLAIKWVKDNIADYGGNPSLITLFGESAGGWSVGFQSINPLNVGLFQRVILQSGTPNSKFSNLKTENLTPFANISGCLNTNKTKIISCMRQMTARELLQVYSKSQLENMFNIVPNIGVAVDGEFIQDKPDKLLRNSSSDSAKFFRSLDMIVGTTNAEGSSIYNYAEILKINVTSGMTTNFLCEFLCPKISSGYFSGISMVSKAICNKYRVPNGDTTMTAEQGRQLVNLNGDLFFVSPAIEFLDLHSKDNVIAKSFQYLFKSETFNFPAPEWIHGAHHASELPFLFGFYLYGSLLNVSVTAEDQQLSTHMLKYWTNFAKTGNPSTGSSIPLWPAYDTSSEKYIQLDLNLQNGTRLFEDRIDFWQDVVPSILNPLVQTKSGPVRGIAVEYPQGTVSHFLGIPYAKPPIGPLRFSKPEPYGPWSTVFNATSFSPSCMQEVYFEADSVVSEDCLFLNIYVPGNISSTKNKPVMIWIHGGGLTIGSGLWYDGSYLALSGDVIVVTLNYRLNIFGFVSSGDSALPGNYGLWDQRLAIEWVKDNIADYGGNPSLITLFGESAGGWSVGFQSINPLNVGLFQRVILQSGTPNSEFANLKTENLTPFANISGCLNTNKTKIINCMRQMTASELLKVYSQSQLENMFNLVPNIGVAVDGEFVQDKPAKLLRNSSSDSAKFFRSLDMIVGTTNAEGSSIYNYAEILKINVTSGMTTNFLCEFLCPKISSGYFNGVSMVSKAICNKYRVPNGDTTMTAEQGRQLVNLNGDLFFVSPAIEFLDLHSKDNVIAKSFQYLFKPETFNFPAPEWIHGAHHASELPFLFGFYLYGSLLNVSVTAEDQQLSTHMLKYWTNFAKTGNPSTGSSIPLWPAYDTSSEKYIQLDLNLQNGTRLFEDRIEFWQDVVPSILNPLVQTKFGPVRGIAVEYTQGTVSHFLGIPYAKPPIGSLRFAKPQIVSTWTNVLDATRFSPSCMQELYFEGDIVSEDCLFLNIYVPNNVSTANSKPVMIWIHGGALVIGSSNLYDGSNLALLGDVIVVTINYRLNIFGFLSSGDSALPGNYGLWDQRLAIKWVKDTIADFGGNPSMITIFGESAGGWSVGFQSISPLNVGLFQRAILQSGTPNSKATLLKTENLTPYASRSGCLNTNKTKIIDCMRQMTTDELFQIYSQIESETASIVLNMAVIVDGELLPDEPAKLLRNISSESSRFFRSLDIIVGTTSAEGSVLPLEGQALFNLTITHGLTTKFLCETLCPGISSGYFSGISMVSKAMCNKYRVPNGDTTMTAEQGRQLVNLYGDLFFVSPAIELLDFHSKDNVIAKSFQYSFNPGTFNFPAPEWIHGAHHGSELPFLFGFYMYGQFLKVSVTAEDQQLSTYMLKYWTNFAKTGNPSTGLSIPLWPAYDTNSEKYIQLDLNLQNGTRLFEDRIEFWQDVVPSILNPLVQTKSGPVRGIAVEYPQGTVSHFLGIPYAKPPIGALRFAKPQIVSTWTDVLDATRHPPACIQDKTFFPELSIEEDCLYMNIYVSDNISDSRQQSVMIWVHGGGFELGEASYFDGSYLATTGDVIVVTINYRLGVFGFISSDDSVLRGNYGLWDQKLAIEWVKDNIVGFGGNPSSITIFGESAGAFSVSLQSISPLNKGLFKRVIAQSGTAFTKMAISEKPKNLAMLYANAVNCTNSTNTPTSEILVCLRTIPAAVLQSVDTHVRKEYNELHSVPPTSSHIMHNPTVDGELIPDTPRKLLDDSSSESYKLFRSLDMMVGTTSGEGAIALMMVQPYVTDMKKGINSSVLCNILIPGDNFGTDYKADTLRNICNKYKVDGISPSQQIEQGQKIVDYYGDRFYVSEAIRVLNLHSVQNYRANSYQYLFAKQLPSSIDLYPVPDWFNGSSHTSELFYMFGTFRHVANQLNVSVLPNDIQLSDDMMTYWSNFAKTGDPNSYGLPKWSQFTNEGKKYIEFGADAGIKEKAMLWSDRMKFWFDLRNIDYIIQQPVTPPLGGTSVQQPIVILLIISCLSTIL